MTTARKITKDDILPLEDYEKVRADRRSALVRTKQDRRVPIGPVATAYFENFETMRHQIQEMLYIEKGGDAQLADELEAYNPLVPNGRELVATVMFEIPDEAKRREMLAKLGGVEDTMVLQVDGEEITGQPETDVDRTTADGKASSVQFIHFPFTDAQAKAFGSAGAQVMIGFRHPDYTHMTGLPETTRAALAEDFS